MGRCIRTAVSALIIVTIACIVTASFFSIEADASYSGIKDLKNKTDGILVTWNKDSSVKGYVIYKKTGSSGNWMEIKKITSKKTTTWIDESVSNGSKYTYRVYAYKGNRIYKNSKTKTIRYIKRARILSISSNQPGEFTVKTDKNSKITGYRIAYSKDSSFKSVKYKYVTKTGSLNKTIGSLSNGRKYYVKVQGFRKNGNKYTYGAYSAKKSVTVKTSYTIYTTLNTVVLRKNKDSSSGISVNYGTKLKIIGNCGAYATGSWYKVKYNGKTYVMWVEKGDTKFTEEKPDRTYANPDNSKYQTAVINLALAIYNKGNTEYAHSQSTWELNENGKYGFDCVGFVKYVHNNALRKYDKAYDLYGTVDGLYNIKYICNKGIKGETKVKTVCSDKWDKSKVKPGDVIFFDEDTVSHKYDDDGNLIPWNHVAIYLGNNEFMHASSGQNGVVISVMDGKFKDKWFVCAKRYIPDEFVPAGINGKTTIAMWVYSAKSTNEKNRIVKVPEGAAISIDYTTCNSKNEEWAWVSYSYDDNNGEGWMYKPIEDGKISISE